MPGLPDPLPAGTRLGSVRVARLLGRGGMGAVYEAHDEASGRGCAVKVLGAALANAPLAVARFEREASAAKRVRHPNVVATLHVGDERGVPFLVLELLPGGSLEDRLRRAGPLPSRDAVAIAAQVARGLDAIHACGLVHRDLKPANVLFDGHGVAKVSDFGLVVHDAERGALTRTGELLGTPHYAAPEQVDAAKNADARADLYALGATLFASLAGRPPFEGELLPVLNQVLSAAPPSVRALVPDVPPALDALVTRLLAKDPAARGGPARALAEELEALLRAPARGRAGMPLAVFAIVALVLVGGAVAVKLARLPGGGAVAPVAPPKAPSPPPPAPARPAEPEAPEWYARLPREERPPLPLPPGLRFGEARGEYVNARDDSVLVYVAPGRSRMGLAPEFLRHVPDEPLELMAQPVQEVELSGYFIGKTEVTTRQFRRFSGETGFRTTAEVALEARRPTGVTVLDGRGLRFVDGPRATWREPMGPDGGPARDDDPVTCVTWEDAQSYCRWAGLRLPSEAQWEKAAAWDPVRRVARCYPWGNEPPDARSPRVDNLADATFRARFGAREPHSVFPDYQDGHLFLAPAGAFPRGASPSGALGMAGNVTEWCEDGYDKPDEHYETPLPRDRRHPASPGCDRPYRPIRGSSWATDVWHAPGAVRELVGPETAQNARGFRVALAPGGGPFDRVDEAYGRTVGPHAVGLDARGEVHAPIVAAYLRLGREAGLVPVNNGGGERAHRWATDRGQRGGWIQDFVGPSGTSSILLAMDGTEAFYVHGDEFANYHRLDGPHRLGYPIEDSRPGLVRCERGEVVKENGRWVVRPR